MSQESPIRKITDAVFGFALAVGALSLTIANLRTEIEIIGGLLLFSLSFIILVVIWWGTSNILAGINTDKPVTVFLIILLLFFVAIEPYLLNILNVSVSLFAFSSTLYAIDMAFLIGVSAMLVQVLINEKKATLTPQQIKSYARRRNNQFIFAGLFVLSIFPPVEWVVGGISARILIWLVALALSVAGSARRRNDAG